MQKTNGETAQSHSPTTVKQAGHIRFHKRAGHMSCKLFTYIVTNATVKHAYCILHIVNFVFQMLNAFDRTAN